MRKARVLFSTVLILSQLALLPFGGSVASANEPLAPVAITEVYVDGSDEWVELYNPNDEQLSLIGLFLWYYGGATPTIKKLVDLDTITIEPKSFALFGKSQPNLLLSGIFLGTQGLGDSAGAVFVAGETEANSMIPADVIDTVAWGQVMMGAEQFYHGLTAKAPSNSGESIERCFMNGLLQVTSPSNTSLEFLMYDSPSPGLGTECIIAEPPTPVVECKGLVINEIGANVDEQFIELFNPTDVPIELKGCQLQTNRNKNTHTLTEQDLAPGEYLTVFIADTNLTLTKTTAGEVYILSSDGLIETDVRTYDDLKENTTWSYFFDGWRQTFQMTPNAQNVDMPYLPCDEGYFRNAATGRCNVIPTIESLVACRDDQYRSEETGRCRNIVATAIRKPCRDDQYRSEETGRCRNLVLASTRKPCKDNQYRSEETGRCRNVPTSTVPAAGFAVQPVKDSGMAFVGWWALGGVALLAVAYAIWEWRRELSAFVTRLFRRA